MMASALSNDSDFNKYISILNVIIYMIKNWIIIIISLDNAIGSLDNAIEEFSLA